MDPTTQFYISFGAQALFNSAQIYYARKQLQNMTSAAASTDKPKKSVSRLWPLSVLLILSMMVWAPMYFSLINHAPYLTASQKRTLISEVAGMRTLMSTVIIAYTNGDHDTLALAQDFADVFKRVGIEPILAFTMPDNTDQSGVILCIKDLNKPPPETEELKAALKRVGIESKVRSFPNRGFARPEVEQKQLVIWVAPAPL
jgi:hypothetical protein